MNQMTPPIRYARRGETIGTVIRALLVLFLAVAAGARAVRSETPSFRVDEVRFQDGRTELAGTLFRPASSAPAGHPAVVVLAGSDRGARGPLRVRIAKHLASNGVAALVYDSPGSGASGGNARLQTLADRAEEARSAAAYLRGVPGIDAKSVGLFGGSEGANVAVIAGARDGAVAFVIAVSGSMGTPALDVLRYSAEKRGREAGLDADTIERVVTLKEILFAFLSGADIVEWPLVEARAASWNDGPWTQLIDAARRWSGNLDAAQKREVLDSFRTLVGEFAGQSWFGIVDVGGAVRRLLQLDAGAVFAMLEKGSYAHDWDSDLRTQAADIACPLLAIWGEEDSFLPPHQSAARLRKMLNDAGHVDFTIQIFENAGHFVTTEGPESPFARGYMETVVQWIRTHRAGN